MNFRNFFIVILFSYIFFSCSDNKKEFDIEFKTQNLKFDFYDVSADFYNLNIPTKEFIIKYPDFFKLEENEITNFRKDSLEQKLYLEIQKKINSKKVKTDLNSLFLRIKHYFPSFQPPTVYLFSSVLRNYTEPIIYNQQDNVLLIQTDCFIGSESGFYTQARIEPYFQETMKPQFLIPKVSLSICETMIPFDANKQEFLNHIIFNGKIMLLQDAFLYGYPDDLKIGMTEHQYNWCKENEYYIWAYFLENELLFSNDIKLLERFIDYGPFSKFYLEIDQESPSGVGVFIGKQIVNEYYQNHDFTLQEILINPNYQEIFSQSGYKPNE